MLTDMSVQKREQKKQETREKFLSAARRIFAAKGFQVTNVSDIVAEVGSGQGTFYYHFEDKQAIFDEILIQFVEKLIKVLLQNNLDTVGRIALANHELAIRNAMNIANVFFDNLDVAKLFFEESRYVGGKAMVYMTNFYRLMYTMIEDGLREGMDEGLVPRTVDPIIFARCYVGATEKAIQDVITSEAPLDIEHFARQIVDFQTYGSIGQRPRTDDSHTENVSNDKI